MRLFVLLLITGCTTLGPMPATTGVTAVPIGRPGAEAQVGLMPGFYLSSSARGETTGAVMQQASLLFEPDRWIGLPGLVLGARAWGKSDDVPVEPYIGYRKELTDGLSVGGGAYGTRQSSRQQLASYRATRVGAEAALDGRVFDSKWVDFHVQGAVSATYIDASGRYCVDEMGRAADCSVDEPSRNTMVDASQTGVYPAATGTLALAFAKGRRGVFDGARLALMFSLGTMPILRDGMKTGTELYTSGGLTLTLGIAD